MAVLLLDSNVLEGYDLLDLSISSCGVVADYIKDNSDERYC